MLRKTEGRLTAVVSVAITFGLAALHLPFPFHGDQAFTLVAAQVVDTGGTLYVDFWDIRQPGAIWFFWLAGRLFGFTEIGVHLFELLWLMAAAWVTYAAAREILTRAWLAALAPVSTIGLYYAHATEWELTQPEPLAALPLAICLLAALRDRHAGSTAAVIARWLMFGLAAGVVATFKLLLLAIPISIAAISLGLRLREAGPRNLLLTRILPGLAGFLSVALIVVVHFWMRGALSDLYWVTFIAPGLSLLEVPRAPYRRLLMSAGWFAPIFLPAAPLVWLGARRSQRRREVLLIGSWIVAAGVVIALQRFHYWPYHFLLFVIPVGLVALSGADAALARWAPQQKDEALIAALLLGPLLLAALPPITRKVSALYEAADAGQSISEGYRRRMSPTYTAMREAAAVIGGAHARPGPIFVFGNPQILYYSGRRQAIPLRGWATYQLLRKQWAEFPVLLERARPVYIFMGNNNRFTIEEKSPSILDLLKSRYRSIWKSDAGEWFELRDN